MGTAVLRLPDSILAVPLVSVGNQLDFNMMKAPSRGTEMWTACSAAASLPGFEPTTYRSQVRRPTAPLQASLSPTFLYLQTPLIMFKHDVVQVF